MTCRKKIIPIWLLVNFIFSFLGILVLMLFSWRKFIVPSNSFNENFIEFLGSVFVATAMMPFGWAFSFLLPWGWLNIYGLKLARRKEDLRPLWLSAVGAFIFGASWPEWLFTMMSV